MSAELSKIEALVLGMGAYSLCARLGLWIKRVRAFGGCLGTERR